MDLLSVIVKPLHSEKSYSFRNGYPKKYVFEVNKNANKHEVGLAFQMIYGIIPKKINMINRKPVPTRTGTRNPGMTKTKKIAYITLPYGVDIRIDETEEPKEKLKKETKNEIINQKTDESTEKPKKGVLSKIIKRDKKETE